MQLKHKERKKELELVYYDDEKYEEKYGQSFDWRLALNSNITKDDDSKENNNDKDEYKIHLEN